MTSDAEATTSQDELDVAGLIQWLAGELGKTITSPEVTRLAAGHSGGAWLIDLSIDGAPTKLVLKAPVPAGVVYNANASREAGIVEAARKLGAPLPRVVAVASGPEAVGRPCFVLEHIAGRTVIDSTPAGYHGEGWYRDHTADDQREIWNSFIDAIAALHNVDGRKIKEAGHQITSGSIEYIEYWRSSLLDVTTAETVPRQLAALRWLQDNVPEGGDDNPSVCMGDARLANAIVDGTTVQALIDFEVAYLGNPASDVGYALFLDTQHRKWTDDPLPGIPAPDETWDRWSERTGFPVVDTAYWTAFGAMVLCITATRAMVQWGLAGPAPEETNPLVAEWEKLITKASR